MAGEVLSAEQAVTVLELAVAAAGGCSAGIDRSDRDSGWAVAVVAVEMGRETWAVQHIPKQNNIIDFHYI